MRLRDRAALVRPDEDRHPTRFHQFRNCDRMGIHTCLPQSIDKRNGYWRNIIRVVDRNRYTLIESAHLSNVVSRYPGNIECTVNARGETTNDSLSGLIDVYMRSNVGLKNAAHLLNLIVGKFRREFGLFRHCCLLLLQRMSEVRSFFIGFLQRTFCISGGLCICRYLTTKSDIFLSNLQSIFVSIRGIFLGLSRIFLGLRDLEVFVGIERVRLYNDDHCGDHGDKREQNVYVITESESRFVLLPMKREGYYCECSEQRQCCGSDVYKLPMIHGLA
jgi:hypothetical protein